MTAEHPVNVERRKKTDMRLLGSFCLEPRTTYAVLGRLGLASHTEYYNKIRNLAERGFLRREGVGQQAKYILTRAGEDWLENCWREEQEQKQRTLYIQVRLLSRFCLQPRTRAQVLMDLMWPNQDRYYDAFRALQAQGFILQVAGGTFPKFVLTRTGEDFLATHWEVVCATLNT